MHWRIAPLLLGEAPSDRSFPIAFQVSPPRVRDLLTRATCDQTVGHK